MKKIGIFGGTFNPIHTGHVKVADDARKKLKLDKVIFVPTGIPPHKSSKNICSSSDRLKMVKLAISKNKYFEVSRTEIKSNKKSYSIETISKFKRKCGRNTKIFFFLGIDAMFEISTWKQAREVVKLCKFVCLSRPGYLVKKLKSRLLKEGFTLSEDFIYLKVPSLKISSTEIRSRIELGLNTKNMLPLEVEKYIREKGLYDRRRNKKKSKKTSD